MRLHTISFVAMLLCLAILPLAPAKAVTVRLPYEGAAILGYNGPQDCDADGLAGLGTVCIDLPRAADSLTLTVEDASRLAIGGTWYLADDAGVFQGAGTFCRGADVALPADASVAIIRLEAVNGPLNCVGSLSAPATKGVVSLRLS